MNFQATLAWIEAHPGTAAWVQGLGTFLAILGTGMVALWQVWATRRDQRLRAVQQVRTRREAAVLITGTVSKFVGQFAKTIGDKPQFDELPYIRSVDRAIQGYYDDLALIPLGELQDGVLCERVLVMRSHIINILEMIESLRAYLRA